MNDDIIQQEIKILSRSTLDLSGVKKVISFNDKEFIIDTITGVSHISGNSLELLNLDTDNGIIKIKGLINGVNFIEKPNKKNKETFITKLFK